ncbi:MAG: c-type cytochrome [Actinomycetota bacterium]
MRNDLIKLWLTGAIVVLLTIATVDLYRRPADQSAPVKTDRGALIFATKGCSGCHSITDVAEGATIGPNLTELARVAAGRIGGMSGREYVTQSIRNPQAFTAPGYEGSFGVMPTLPLSDEELSLVVEFLIEER